MEDWRYYVAMVAAALFKVVLSKTLTFNGDVSELSDRVTFARNATNAEKQAAVRSRVNALLSDREPGVTLNNANIQIVGLPT